ncbi:MAG: hypothetical protein ABR543_05390 [Gemmatimonadaceae bacterium]
MKIALLFDGASALGKSPDLLILATVEAVEAALAGEGNHVVRVPCYFDARWVERVRRGKFDLVFNLCEGIDGEAEVEPAVISALEFMGVPFTGSSSWTAALCLRKPVVNALLARAGIPIPRFDVSWRGGALPIVGFPAICKPSAEDASVGVEQRSVVRTVRALTARIEAMHEVWDEVLVQRFIDGREVNVGIVGDTVLPIAEIEFDKMPKKLWRIVSYRSKWETGCEEDLGAKPSCPADLPPELSIELKRLAIEAWKVVGGDGYGRVDFRIDKSGRPWLLEVNANPDIAPDAGLARMAGAAGIDYASLILAVCQRALTRKPVTTPDLWERSQRLSGVRAATGGDNELDLFAVGQR